MDQRSSIQEQDSEENKSQGPTDINKNVEIVGLRYLPISKGKWDLSGLRVMKFLDFSRNVSHFQTVCFDRFNLVATVSYHEDSVCLPNSEKLGA